MDEILSVDQVVFGRVAAGIHVEGAAFEVTGSQTDAGSSKNTFNYTLKAGTCRTKFRI